MKLIIECWRGEIYAYRESDEHFKVAQPKRETLHASNALLDEECNLSSYSNRHFVFDLAEPKRILRGKALPEKPRLEDCFFREVVSPW